MKGFDRLIGESSREMEEQLLNLVLPRSCGEAGQGSKEWFLDRMFSGTSSQIYALVEAAAPLLLSDDDVGVEVKKCIRDVLKYARLDKILEDVSAATAADDAPGSQPPEEEEKEEKSEEQMQAEDLIENLTDETSTNDDDFKTNLPTMENKILNWMVHLLSHANRFKENTKASNKKKIEQWLEAPRSHRRFVMMKNDDLKKLAKKKKIPFAANANKAALVSLLAGSNDDNTSDDTTHSPDLGPLVAIIRQSFLRPQQDREEKSAAKVGRENEKVFLEEFWNLYQTKELVFVDGVVPSDLSVVYRPGLVAKKADNTFVKDSADGVVLFQSSDVSFVVIDCAVLFLCCNTFLTFLLSSGMM